MQANSASPTAISAGCGGNNQSAPLPRELATLDADLRAILDSRPPASASRVQSVTKQAVLHAREHASAIAQLVARFIRKCSPPFKLSGLYIVDSICRASLKPGDHGVSGNVDPYGPHFEPLLPALTAEIQKCSDTEREKIKRLIKIWRSTGVFRSDFLDKAEERWVRREPSRPSSAANASGMPPASTQTPTAPAPDATSIIQSLSLLTSQSTAPTAPALPAPMAISVPSVPTISLPGATALPPQQLAAMLASLGGAGAPSNAAQLALATAIMGFPAPPPPSPAPSSSHPAPAVLPPSLADDPAFNPSSAKAVRSQPFEYREPERDMIATNWAQTPVTKPIGPWVQVEGGCGPTQIKVLSRTLYVGNVTPDMSRTIIMQVFSAYGDVDSVMINHSKSNCFLKMRTRAQANDARQALDQAPVYNTTLRVKWGCGFGPKPIFDYSTGCSILDIFADLDVVDWKWLMTADAGGIRTGVLRGGLTIEEPDVNMAEMRAKATLVAETAARMGGVASGPIATMGSHAGVPRRGNQPPLRGAIGNQSPYRNMTMHDTSEYSGATSRSDRDYPISRGGTNSSRAAALPPWAKPTPTFADSRASFDPRAGFRDEVSVSTLDSRTRGRFAGGSDPRAGTARSPDLEHDDIYGM
ncbi:hypothetical protein AMAG_08827 [Allomyces macrogynus ATCC 38327]|uniref:CID domain-containing protein n=1 Tax=Allomyces macrogynus (strain ATCC 38327) TaxID=578462 RepID=A0A0L0SME9_ALLM3|nr:hypothetical protein AMAG_08827 [Allomyces macrogynus ATCC 38327]|eukprot:KNE63741.1 hypothetical protein AMAG_08827 [Allomyces macrogynus ATCC 38327]